VVAQRVNRGGYRLCLLPALAWLILLVVGYAPTQRWGGDGAPKAMMAAQLLVLAVAYGTMMPSLRRMETLDGSGRLRLGLKVSGIRFLLVAAIGAVIALRSLVQPTAFLIWLGISYVVLTKIETLALIYWTGKLDRQ
jgi:hypothetical protein